MILSFLKMLITSFIGTFGFGILLHAPKKSLLLASALGGASYACYWGLMQLGMSENFSMFLAALLGSFAGQLAARKLKMIATVFIVLAIIPLVPGLGLYRCMSYLAQGDTSLGASTGVQAMAVILMIAIGIGVGSFLVNISTKNIKRGRSSGLPSKCK